MSADKPTIIAFYLPQFHPFKENDQWWGKGFTEWTNVGKAKPLFRGHYQPRVPADLGYYDLRLPLVRQQQAELAREAGVDAFCYWHYWFGGEGRQLLNNIIDEVRVSSKPDFPFCLGWANDSWKAKQWNKDSHGDRILMEQRYEGEKDYRLHYEYVRELFRDHRYVRIDNCPMFYIYRPLNFPDIRNFIELWNKWVKEDGIAQKVYFVANLELAKDYDLLKSMGFDAVNPANFERAQYYYLHRPRWIRGIHRVFNRILGRPIVQSYAKMNRHIWIDGFDDREDVIPHLLPNWDHSPRSGQKGRVLVGSTPALFKQQAEKVLSEVMKKKNRVVMLKSWNEWAEGNYMEPDLRFGKGYIRALHEAKEKC